MAAGPKPKAAPSSTWPVEQGTVHEANGWLWIALKGEWRLRAGKPEEAVRQNFVRHLVESCGYALAQMDQERRLTSGSRSARADIVVWETPAAKAANRTPVLVVECKAESVEINLRDYYQGESYTRSAGCEFFVATNSRFTGVFRLVPGAPGEFVQVNAIPKALDWGDARRIEAIRQGQRAFDRKEFQDLLFDCHSILRDVHKMDPGRAFDTMSKVLFIKMFIERSGQHGTFTTDFITRRAATRLSTDPAVHDGLFEQTKRFYQADALFAADDRLDISEATFERIVKKLQRFDLARTGDDIKGLAFERFLGSTFRGELGQFFTPRPVVDFMVRLLDPREGELICDPAAGSGGFLIRAFEHVREAVAEDIQTQKDAARAAIEAEGLPVEEEEGRVDAAFADLNRELLPSDDQNRPVDTRVGRLAWRCIHGTDAEPRAARTAKMNMIMHGDGHGGIHHHDGLVDVNGILPGRFDVVLSNPPFGSSVGKDQKVGGSAEARVEDDPAILAKLAGLYGEPWRERHEVLAAAVGGPILDLYEIGKGKTSRQTEVVFVERCLQLLRPGGRAGIVLPDGNLNNPSLSWLRRWCEGMARIDAVVSLPEETFRSAAATVKASIVVLRRFTAEDELAWEAAWSSAHAALDTGFEARRDLLCREADAPLQTGGSAAVAAIIADLAALGIARAAPSWFAEAAPPYPRGVGASRPTRPRWVGTATDRSEAARLRRAWDDAFASDPTARAVRDGAAGRLATGLRAVDNEHDAALWAHVREAFDYPVFVAAPRSVGITATGDTGEHVADELPRVLDAYREFRAWVEAGSLPVQAPSFAA